MHTVRGDEARSLVGGALALGVVQIVGSYFAGKNQADRNSLDALAYVVLAAGPVALLGRRRYPALTLGVTMAITVLYIGLGYPYGPVYLSMVVAIVAAVMAGRRIAAWSIAAAGYAGMVVVESVTPKGNASFDHSIGLGAWTLVVLVVAEVVRAKRERGLETLRASAEESRRQASEERLRIARELHDVLAHNISLINVQAGVALHLIDEQPEQARSALAAIKDASKDALGELRSVLDVLRRGDGPAPRAPEPGLDQLDDLVSRAGTAGLDVHVEVDGRPRPVPAGADLAAFRIVQEALTNVTRHAGSTQATVRVAYREHDLVVQVDDDGRGPSTSGQQGSGSGIRGMRERVTALGGRLEAGPRPGGGFRVRASLPLTGGS